MCRISKMLSRKRFNSLPEIQNLNNKDKVKFWILKVTNIGIIMHYVWLVTLELKKLDIYTKHMEQNVIPLERR